MLGRRVSTIALALALWSCVSAAARKELRIPLEYDAASNLYTAVVSIGTPARTYRTLVDTGSNFLLLQRTAVDADESLIPASSTRRPFAPPPNKTTQKVGLNGKFVFTNTDGSGATALAKVDKFRDVFAFAGTDSRDIAIGSTDLGDLQGLDGILGLAPPMSRVKPQPAPPGSPPTDPLPTPDQDLSFLLYYLGGDKGTGFYVTHNSTTATPGGGELVFPATDFLPSSIPGYDTASYFQVDPATGCTFPHHSWWGIAHRPDLALSLGGDGVQEAMVGEDVVVDAVILDSGTSGIMAPNSELEKIAARLGDRVLKRVRSGPPSMSLVSLRVACDAAPLETAFVFAGKRFSFPSIRPSPLGPDGTRGRDMRQLAPGEDNPKLTDIGADGDLGVLGVGRRWKSYADAYHGFVDRAVAAGQSAVDGYVARLSSALQPGGLQKRRVHRHHKRQNAPAIDLDADNTASCSFTILGSEEMDHMFQPANASLPGPKVWLLGQEFFQHNLVYHNIEHETITILTKSHAP